MSWHCLWQPSDYATGFRSNSHLFHYSHIPIKWSGCLWEAPRWNTQTRQTNTFDSVIHLMPFKTCVMGCLFNGSWGAIRAWIRWPRLYLQKLSQMILKVSRQELMWTKFAPAICFTHRLKSHFNFSNWLISEYVYHGYLCPSWYKFHILTVAFRFRLFFCKKGSVSLRFFGLIGLMGWDPWKTEFLPPTNPDQSVERC